MKAPLKIEDLLISHGVKPSSQRVVITDFLLNTKTHPTAEEVLQAVENQLPVKISRATIYNTLNTLTEAGVIREISIDPGIIRYDGNNQQHHHFVNLPTGQIHDLPWNTVSTLNTSLGNTYKVYHYEVIFYGTIEPP